MDPLFLQLAIFGLLAAAAIFAAGIVVVVLADDGILDDGGTFYLAADAAVSLGLAWLGVALRTPAAFAWTTRPAARRPVTCSGSARR